MILVISNALFVQLAGVRQSAAAQDWQPRQVFLSYGADDDAAPGDVAWRIVRSSEALPGGPTFLRKPLLSRTTVMDIKERPVHSQDTRHQITTAAATDIFGL